MRARSTVPSVCPSRSSTPPGIALSGNIWPGLIKSAAWLESDTRASTVLARSEALIPVVVFAGTTSLAGFVEIQAGSWNGLIPSWYLFALPPSLLLFFIAVVAETNRAPFDLVEAESEIVGGYHTEYSGIRFAMFFLAEYINMFNVSAIATTLFLGGWNGPTWDLVFPAFISGLFPIFWFMLKTWILLFIFIWLRATLPRMRYDQLMSFGWKRLIPVSLAWLVLATAATAVRRFGAPWG